jgi:glutathione peroxidase
LLFIAFFNVLVIDDCATTVSNESGLYFRADTIKFSIFPRCNSGCPKINKYAFLYGFFITTVVVILNFVDLQQKVNTKKMQRLILFFWIILSAQAFGQTKTFHNFSVTDIHGEIFDFSVLKGKKVLIVNTASECTLTPQFKKLQELYEKYGGDDFEIIGFPCNDFGSHEQADNEQIYEFCTAKYGVSFPMMAKISIKGNNIHPLFRWLTSSKENGTLDAKVMWNFQKIMVDKEGLVTDFVSPVTGPMNKKILEWLHEE